MAQINTAQRPGTQLRRPVLRDISLSALLFLAARASVIGMFPFGTAFFAACFDKGIAYIGVIVMCLGLVSAGAGIGTVKYLIAVLLFWIYIKNSRVKSTAAESAVCGLSVLIGGASVLAYTYVGIYDVMLLLTESVASALIYAVYVKAKQFFEDRRERAHISQEELTAVAVCAGIFITGLSGINLPYGISLANIAAVVNVHCAPFEPCGIGQRCAVYRLYERHVIIQFRACRRLVRTLCCFRKSFKVFRQNRNSSGLHRRCGGGNALYAAVCHAARCARCISCGADVCAYSEKGA